MTNTDFTAEEMELKGLVYDARVGSWVSKKVFGRHDRIFNDPTAFEPKPNYAPDENVHDGDGFGE